MRALTAAALKGSPYTGCYVLAATIFALGLARDYLCAARAGLRRGAACSAHRRRRRARPRFDVACRDQPAWAALDTAAVQAAAAALFAVANVLVLSSMWVLGITGTYLGSCPAGGARRGRPR